MELSINNGTVGRASPAAISYATLPVPISATASFNTDLQRPDPVLLFSFRSLSLLGFRVPSVAVQTLASFFSQSPQQCSSPAQNMVSTYSNAKRMRGLS